MNDTIQVMVREGAGTEMLLDEKVGSVSSGKLIRRIVARKQSSGG